MKPLAEQTLYEILEVPFDAPDGEILRACERVQALFGPGSIATYSLIDPDEVRVLGERIEEARSVLLDPASRADYDDRITAPPPGLFPVPPPAPAVAPVELPPPQQPVAEVVAPVAAAEPAPAEPAVAPAASAAAPTAEVAVEVAPAPPEVATASIEVAAPAEQPAAPPAEPAPLALKRRRRKLPPVIRPLASPKPLPPAVPPDGAAATPAPAEARDAEPDPGSLPIPLERVATPIPLATPVVPIPLATPLVPIPLATPLVSIPRATPVPISPPFAAIAAAPSAPPPAPFVAAPAPPDPVPRAPRPPDRDIFLHEGTRFTGEVLRRAREARGLTVVQLCERTKITRHHIEHLEADRYDKLPAMVYLRGILVAVSKELRLDGQKVARSYLDAIAAASGAPLTTPRR
ncbi:MAG: helix-turn-helix domain-containing protein [Anaeromyxobacteraceae bacterium]